MNLCETWGQLYLLRAQFSIHGDVLTVRAPLGSMTAELREAIAGQKAALIDLISKAKYGEPRRIGSPCDEVTV